MTIDFFTPVPDKTLYLDPVSEEIVLATLNTALQLAIH